MGTMSKRQPKAISEQLRETIQASGYSRYRLWQETGISAQTFNFYLQAVRQFARWMVRDGRASESPVAHLQGLNVKADRRALTVQELGRLLRAAASGPECYGMSGPEG